MPAGVLAINCLRSRATPLPQGSYLGPADLTAYAPSAGTLEWHEDADGDIEVEIGEPGNRWATIRLRSPDAAPGRGAR
jgi:hypothetical protein